MNVYGGAWVRLRVSRVFVFIFGCVYLSGNWIILCFTNLSKNEFCERRKEREKEKRERENTCWGEQSW